MAVTPDQAGPYAPASAVLDMITRHRTRGLPAPINADVLGRAGISPSLIPRTLQALQTLDLVDDSGMPTPTFEALRLAPEAEYKTRLEDWLKSAYAGIFSFVDLTADDETSIRDAFRGYSPIGQQDRMVSLFQGLSRAAGLLPEKASTPRPRPSSPAPRRSSPKSPTPPRTNGSGSSSLPPALAGLMASLPAESDGWTAETRDKFLSTFKAVLDFCIPVVESTPSTTKENGGHD